MGVIPRLALSPKSSRCVKQHYEGVVLISAFAIALAGCQGDKLLNPAVPKAPRESKALPSRPGLSGFLSANLSLKTPGGWKEYRSGKIPFLAVTTNTQVVVPADAVLELGRSMAEVSSIGHAPANLLHFAQRARGEVAFAASTGDPEATLDSFAQANPVPQQGEDIYLAQPDWEMLTGDSYSEDIGDGTIARVVVDPISFTNPNGAIQLYLNGRLIVTVNPQYAPESGGWQEQTSVEATYSYTTGAQTSWGTRHVYGPQEPTKWRPQTKDEVDFYREHPRFAKFLDNLLPPRAYAQDNCYYYMRGVLIGVVGMYFAGRTGNPGSFILSWASVVNGVHGFARCKERQRKQ